ncbi:MAG: xanthine dehydrogenase family protein subunit M [Peptococcaceae bacterium]|nr:xanthine dehydrogenase family protein subunit M [Peptococcaceae bacterium]
MNRCNFVSPRAMSEVLDILAADPEAKLLAGGTDLIVQMREGRVSPRTLVDLSRFGELSYIKLRHDTLHVGCMTTFNQVARNPLVVRHAPALAQAARQVGSVQIRNQGTIGGNLANASPAADSIPPLIALGAKAQVVSRDGSRSLAIEDLLAGVGINTLLPGEMIAEINFSLPAPRARSAFVKLGRRKAMAIARISMAGLLVLSADGLVTEARLALGAVGATVFRALEAEAALLHKPLDRAVVAACLQAVQDTVAQKLGRRASATYKREAIRGVAEELFFQLVPELSAP